VREQPVSEQRQTQGSGQHEERQYVSQLSLL
jgi:hypothetical protein